MAARRIIVLLLLPWLGLFPLPWAVGGFAAEPPVCTATVSGSVACIAGRLCRCGYARGGSTIEEPAGYRWDCGLLRANCHRPPDRPPGHEVLDDLRLIVPIEPLRRQPRASRPARPWLPATQPR